jgi:hypothetical protein
MARIGSAPRSGRSSIAADHAPWHRQVVPLFAPLVLALATIGCGDGSPEAVTVPLPEVRERCADRNPLRNLYFGDLHVHTALSFDSWVFDVRPLPEGAYRFARGEPLHLPPLDAAGRGTREVRIDRPLDFAAVTDHAEFLGESEVCLDANATGYDSPSCLAYRAGGTTGQAIFGVQTSLPNPARDASTCGEDGADCRAAANDVWRRTIEAAEEAYDRTSACSFTTFVGYEYTANTGGSSQHRNVLFRNERAPAPISYLEQPTADGLWAELRRTCLEAGTGCDAIAIPHNPNQSNGNLFRFELFGATTEEARREAEQQSAIEPLVEVFQHKGDSECANGLSGILGEPDELCGFEKMRTPPFDDCGDGTGAGGTGFGGCVSRRDFVRGALLEGLLTEATIGANPFRLGMIGGSDTHDATAGAVAEDRFAGHRGNLDDEAVERLSPEGPRSGTIFNPGGLAAVWAEENSREAIFAALRRREVYATSGPRMVVRFFGGFGLAADLCTDPEMIARADADGVPMGSMLEGPPAEPAAPTFLVSALRDPGTPERPGTPLQRIQIVKGWIEDGQRYQRVFDVAGDPVNGADVDTATCATRGGGFDSLCASWTDPDFAPDQYAFYYARVVENPSCRWTTFACNALSASERPESCGDPGAVKVIQERAWSSPIWWSPPSGSRPTGAVTEPRTRGNGGKA